MGKLLRKLRSYGDRTVDLISPLALLNLYFDRHTGAENRPAFFEIDSAFPALHRLTEHYSEIKEELRRRMHQAIPEQGRWLAQVIRGYLAYHAVPTNSPALSAFRHQIQTS